MPTKLDMRITQSDVQSALQILTHGEIYKNMASSINKYSYTDVIYILCTFVRYILYSDRYKSLITHIGKVIPMLVICTRIIHYPIIYTYYVQMSHRMRHDHCEYGRDGMTNHYYLL